MNIVHVSTNSSYTEGWSYHENLLPKYHGKLGNKVSLIVVNKSRPNQALVTVPESDFDSVDGFHVYYRKIKRGFLSVMEIYPLLCELNPDVIFFHGMNSASILQAVKYKKNADHPVTIYQDNHLDYNIGYKPDDVFKDKVVCSILKCLHRMTAKNIKKVYGVTPWRKEYAIKYFGVDPSKADVLIMGADDEKIDFQHRDQIRNEIRQNLEIQDDDFLIVTGGKIDKRKRIEELIKAVAGIPHVKLLVFGNLLDDVKDSINETLKTASNVIYIGWIESEKAYDYFFAADLVCFPGQHSVLWEQACATKTPCLFASWPGMDHVNNGGNSDFIKDVSVEGIRNKILEYVYTDKYYQMKEIARSDASNIYLYSNIAKKSLEVE